MSDLSGPAQVERVFLFTDLQGSTSAWEHTPTQMNDVLAGHDRIMRDAIADAGGTVFSTAGDAFSAAFEEDAAAVGVAVEVQRTLARRAWPEGLEPRVRMGIHRGPAYPRDDNFFGSTLNRAARLMSAAHGGQVVVSDEVRSSVEPLPNGVSASALGRHRFKDVDVPLDVWQLEIDGLPSDFPPLRSAEETVVRVPVSRTNFLGREEDLAALRDRLAEPCVVTIVAAGGTGKTRLAFETALLEAARHPGGVHAVELADGGPADVARRVVESVLGDTPVARAEAAADPVASLVDHLRDRRALLVLDNCEHVLDAAADLVDELTRACASVSVIATSREPLGVPDEQVHRLEALAVAAAGDGPSPAALLFADRAAAVDPDWGDLAADTAAIDAICEAVEGLPLAIELAAARCRSLTPTEILEQLDRAGVSVLSVRRGRAERHRSLEATIRWSYDLLDGDERRVLASLSVFRGGAPLAAVEAVGSAVSEDVDLELVESLVDKSLVATSRVSRQVRFGLSEPIRQFAEARLAEFGAGEEAEIRHHQFFTELATSAAPKLDTDADPAAVARLTTEHDNFLAAIDRALDRGDARGAAHLARRLHVYWEETGHLATGADRLAAAVAADPDDPTVLWALGALVPYETMCGRLHAAQERAALLEPLLADGVPGPLQAAAGFAISFVEQAAGNFERAIDLMDTAGDRAEEAFFARQILLSAAYNAATYGDPHRSLALARRARGVDGPAQEWFPAMIGVIEALADSIGGQDRSEELAAGFERIDAMGLRFRGILASAAASLGLFSLGDPTAAERAWRRGLFLSREMGHLYGAWILLHHAAVGLASDDPTRAARCWGAIERFGSREGYRPWNAFEAISEQSRVAAAAELGDTYGSAVREGAEAALSGVVDDVLER